MTTDDFYWYASVAIFIPWALLIFLPRGRYTEPVAFGAAILLLLAAAWFTLHYFTDQEAGGNLFSLEGVKNIFRNRAMLMTGWLNYLSFCLLVGTWQVHDAREQKIPHLFVIPSLILTLLTGPMGMLVYMLVRFFKTRKWEIK